MNRIIISPEVERLATLAVDAAFAVYTELGPGLLESAYQVCFVHELGMRGVAYQKELTIPLNYKGVRIEVGFRADVVFNRFKRSRSSGYTSSESTGSPAGS